VKQFEEMRSVSVKRERMSQASVSVERNDHAACAIIGGAISRQPNGRAGRFECATRRLQGSRRMKYSMLVRLEPTHALRKEFPEKRRSLAPNQPPEPTRPIVRFREVVLRINVRGCSGLVAHL